jgi:hypothetical protein
MLHISRSGTGPVPDNVMRAMFAARKAVFVDLLKWDVPVIDGQFENTLETCADAFSREAWTYAKATRPRYHADFNPQARFSRLDAAASAARPQPSSLDPICNPDRIRSRAIGCAPDHAPE